MEKDRCSCSSGFGTGTTIAQHISSAFDMAHNGAFGESQCSVYNLGGYAGVVGYDVLKFQ